MTRTVEDTPYRLEAGVGDLDKGVGDLDLDVQGILELAGKGFHDLTDRLVGVVAEGDFRETFTVRITCFSEGRLSGFDVSFFRKIVDTIKNFFVGLIGKITGK